MKKRTLIILSTSLILSIAGLSQVFRKNLKEPVRAKSESATNMTDIKNNKMIENNAIIQYDLTGTWYWQSDNGKNNTELYLTQNGNSVVGKHCGSFYEGSKLDCISEDDTNSIILTQLSTNVYEGNLISGFSEITIPIRITYNSMNKTIFFHQITQPAGEYYLPNDVNMTLAPD